MTVKEELDSKRKSWKHEAVSLNIEDVIRYNAGWLAIFSFQAKGTTWYMGLPAERSKIEANTRGQKLLSKIQ